MGKRDNVRVIEGKDLKSLNGSQYYDDGDFLITVFDGEFEIYARHSNYFITSIPRDSIEDTRLTYWREPYEYDGLVSNCADKHIFVVERLKDGGVIKKYHIEIY